MGCGAYGHGGRHRGNAYVTGTVATPDGGTAMTLRKLEEYDPF